MREGAKFYRMKAHIVRNRINLSWVGSVWAHASSFVGIGGFLLLAPSSNVHCCRVDAYREVLFSCLHTFLMQRMFF